MSIAEKADYVRSKAGSSTGGHHCHWTGCTASVPPAMWGCRKHWYMLPLAIRTAIWNTFRPGQEKTKTPSAAYVEAAQRAREWIAEHHGAAPQQGGLNL